MAKAYLLRQLPGTVAALFADTELKVGDMDALDKLLQRADDSYAQFTQTAESRDIAWQTTVAEVTKEVDTLNTQPKQQKANKNGGAQDSKPKKLVNGMCCIHAKYGTQAQKRALPEKCLHRNQITLKSEKSHWRSGKLDHLNNEIQTYDTLYEDQILSVDACTNLWDRCFCHG